MLNLKIYPADNYSLADTLNCGQVFRFTKNSKNGAFEIKAANNFCLAKQADGIVYIMAESGDEQFWTEYLNLRSYTNGIVELCESYSDTLGEMARYSQGIRLLKQDTWETAVSFIISQRNNIPKIKSTIEKICMLTGKMETGKCYSWYAFPTPKELLDGLMDPAKRDKMGLGYRLDYLICLCKEVLSGGINLEQLKQKNYQEIMVKLQSLYGVGPKVANCIALFGMQHTEAFPIDIWMERAINNYFSGNFDTTYFGEYAGLVQQYIFFYIRSKEGK